MAKLSTWQAKRLLEAYAQQQNAAAEQQIAAYDRVVDAALAETQADVQGQQQAADAAERAAWDRAAVEALAQRHRVAERLASLGLSRSGAAESAQDGIARARRQQQTAATETRRAALSALSKRLLTARTEASGKKEKNAATVRRSVAAKIAEKQLSLNKQTM